MLAACCTLSALATPNPTPLRAFRAFDKKSAPGLPQSTVLALLQDEHGVLWIATLDGLASFDGTEIRPVDDPKAPTYGALFSLAQRRQGGFYVGGSSAVYRFDGRAWDRLPAKGAILSLAEDEAGQLWAINRQGEVTWRPADPQVEGWQDAPRPTSVTHGVALATSADGALWLAGRHHVFQRRDHSWLPVAGGAPAPAVITAMLPAADGTCWVGTEQGTIFYAAPGDGAWTALDLEDWQGGWFRTLAQDRRGRIWAGGNDGGVAFGRKDEPWTVWRTSNGLHREACVTIFADREGTVWLTFNGHGILQWVGEMWSHRNRWHGDEEVEARLQVFGISGTHDGGFLAAVFNRGIWRWDGTTMRQYGEAEGIEEDVRSAIEPRPELIWVAARFGIYASEDGGPFRKTLDVENGFVYGFHHAPDGNWYASTSAAGLFRYEAGSWRPATALNEALPDPNVRAVLWRRNGELWVGTMNGLAIFDGERPVPLPPQLGESLPTAIHALLEVDGNKVWAGGFGGIGIWHDDVGRRLTVDDGLPGNTIYALARAADGAIWAGGSSGVGRFTDGAWTLYGLDRGLIEAECNHYGLWPAPDGTIFVGTMASLARFDPHIEPLPPPPLRVYWQQRPMAETATEAAVRLPADQRSLRLSWHAPWVAPRKLEYRSRIPRLDTTWSTPQAESALVLENLGPGAWTAEVAARFAGDTEWSQPIATHFTIAPYWWETWYLRLASVLAILLAVFGLIHWRTRRLAARAEELERAVKEHVARIKILGGLLPICSHCKKVRDDAGYWQQIESYIVAHSEAEFSHGLCPSCFSDLYPEYVEPEGTPLKAPGTAASDKS